MWSNLGQPSNCSCKSMVLWEEESTGVMHMKLYEGAAGREVSMDAFLAKL